jgi:hypothetical protein
MSTQSKKRRVAVSVAFNDEKAFVELNDGLIIGVPFTYTKRLQNASKVERESVEFIGGGVGLHFPLIDEDISIDGIVRDLAPTNEVVRVNISLPKPVLNELDRKAKAAGMSRSAFIAKLAVSA